MLFRFISNSTEDYAPFEKLCIVGISNPQQVFQQSEHRMLSLDKVHASRRYTYLRSPTSGSRPVPIESRSLCKLSFSVDTSWISGGKVRNNTLIMSW